MHPSGILERAKSIATNPAFAVPMWWLTFYLCGDPQKLDGLSLRLAEQGWVNTDGAEAGFLYPKIEVRNDPALVAWTVGEVRQLVQAAGADVIAVDVDTSPDVEVSLFEQLVQFDGNGS